MARRHTSIRFRDEPAPEPVCGDDLDRLPTPDYNRLVRMWFQSFWVNEHDVPTEPSAFATFDDGPLNDEFRRYTKVHGSRAWYRGGTVQEIWLARQIMTHTSLMVLLSSTQPECRVDRTTRYRRWPPDEIVSCVETVLELGQGCRALVYDGRNGYTIFPRGFDLTRDALIYTDPWPGESVLCAKQNHAGARAIRYTRGNWLLSRNDFTRVLYAAFITDHIFSLMGGDEMRMDESSAHVEKPHSAKRGAPRKHKR